jgi:hypothetical protein
MRVRAEMVIACIILAGCQRSPFADQYTTSRPREEDVTGQYVFSRDTVTWGKSAAIKNCRIELRADRTFIATNVPRAEFPGRGSDYLGDLINASGTWRIDNVGGGEDWRGKVVTHWGISFEATSANVNVQDAGFTGHKPPYGLIFSFDDPDSGLAVFLRKNN